jgi:hypothetical protein
MTTTIERRENRYYNKTGNGVFAAKAKQQSEGGGRVWVPNPKAENGGNWKYEQENLNGHIIGAKITDTKFGPQFSFALDGGDGFDHFQVNLKRDNGQVNDDFTAVVNRIKGIDLDKKLRITCFKPDQPKTYKTADGETKEFYPQYLVFFQGRSAVEKALKFVPAEDCGEEYGHYTLDGNRVPASIWGEVGSKKVVDHSPVIDCYRKYVENWIEVHQPLFDERYALFLSRFGDDDEDFVTANARAVEDTPAKVEEAVADSPEDGNDLPF